MKTVEILNEHNLKRTSCREGILDAMISNSQALSEEEIRERMVGNYDRTTFYRSFKTLEEHNIIHKIVIDGQTVKYALDDATTHSSTHAHFYCNECHTVTCLDDVPVQRYQLPDGYSESETDVLIKGICPTCQNENQR